jgi:hypothetical protein
MMYDSNRIAGQNRAREILFLLFLGQLKRDIESQTIIPKIHHPEHTNPKGVMEIESSND